MKKKNFLKILTVFLFLPQFVLGALCEYLGGGKNLMTGVNTSDLKEGIPTLIGNIIDFLIDCLVRYALILTIMIGGGFIMFSTGNPGMVSRGKAIVLSSLVGSIIIAVGKGLLEKGLDGVAMTATALGIILYAIGSRISG